MKLTREDILRAMNKIDALARERGVILEMSIYGGAAMTLAFKAREATRDVDAVASTQDGKSMLQECTRKIAEEEGWQEDWLNDGVKGFLSANESMRVLEGYDPVPPGGLRVLVPVPEYLFAMKCMSMREDTPDWQDIEYLAEECGISSVDEAIDLVSDFYPANLVPAKVAFGIQEFMEQYLKSQETGRQFMGQKV